jgi:DnaJ homolog subfamily C member 9
MDQVYQEVMCSNRSKDDKRFREILDAAISNGEVTAWDSYKKETAGENRKRLRREKKEEVEALSYAQELGVADQLFGSGGASRTKKKKKDDTSDLAALIQQRQKTRAGALFDTLTAKYGKGSKTAGKGKKRPSMDEPPEEAFERNRAKKARS